MIKNHGICQVSLAPIRAEKRDESEIVSQLLFGDYVEVTEVDQPWIKIYFPADNYHGYMDFKQLLYIEKEEYDKDANLRHSVISQNNLKIDGPIGIQHLIRGSNLPNFKNGKIKMAGHFHEVIDDYQQLNCSFVETALSYLNTPYLWGGKGIYGIDCSGFTQIVAKVHGIGLPRDATEQVHIGTSINFEDNKTGDLIYFINKNKLVHHVGIIVEEGKVIHAAGHVRIDSFDKKGIFREDFSAYTHIYHSIKRL